MMLAGNQDLASGVTEIDVTFSSNFSNEPVVIIQWMRDGTPVSSDQVDTLGPVRLQSSAGQYTGFKVYLSSPVPDADYQLSWVALDTDSDLVVVVTSTPGKRLNELDSFSNEPADTDTFLVNKSSSNRGMLLPWSIIKGLITTTQVDPPSGSADSGSTGEWALDDDYLYFYDESNGWGRIAIAYSW